MAPQSGFGLKADIDWSQSRPSSEGQVLICAINMDRSPDRWQALRQQLDASGLPYLRLSAVDGRNLPESLRARIDAAHFQRANGRSSTPGDLGCYFSHVAAWSVLKDVSQPYLIVVEDDAVFAPDWTNTLQSVLSHYQSGMLLKLSFQRKGVVKEVEKIDPTHRLVRPLTHQACNAAYLIDRKAADRLSGNAYPMFLPADHYVESPWLTGVAVRTIMPALARQRGVESTISKQQKFHWTQRIPTLLYRIKSHSLRLWHSYFRMA